MTPQPLVVSALGPIQIRVGESIVGNWRYLDSLEVLLFLLCNTTRLSIRNSPNHELHGKTKEQIGQALWLDASPEQVDSNLKARLHDVRQRLGSREWVLFEGEHYKFNYDLPLIFDVNTFTELVIGAEQQLRNADADAAVLSLQKAAALYRGDFMDDFRKRRTILRLQADDDEIEWYVRKRYELQTIHHDALERLGQLLFERERYDEAGEIYRTLIAHDEYDDHAHKQLMLALARRGKKSQALQHFRVLVKQRADTPPEPDLIAAAEQIKRGEIALSFPDKNAAIPFKPPLATEPKVPPPFQVPADLLKFVGRESEFHVLAAELTGTDTAPPYCLVGMGGIGKTSLAIHLAHTLRDHFPDGVLWGHVATSEPLAIMDSWARAFGCDYSGLPDIQTRAAALRSLLAGKKVLFLLDDVHLAERVRPLLLASPPQRVLITTRDADLAAAIGAQVRDMKVFAAAESVDLLTQRVGKERVEPEPESANEICALLGQLPLALDIVCSRLVSRPKWTLQEMALRLHNHVRRLDELALGDRAVRASFATSWDELNPEQRHSFGLLGAFEGRSFAAPAFAYVAESNEQLARERLDAFVALSLLSREAGSRYRQHPLLSDFAREKLADPTGAHARFSNYYLSFATEHQHDAPAIDEEWDNLTAGIELADTLQLWQTVIDYGDVLADVWVARGRFSEARRAYPAVMRAARELEEQDPYIAANLNWGKACIDQSDYAEAEDHLLHGLQTSREVNDSYGIATAQFLRARLAVVQARFDEATRLLEESEQLYNRISDPAGVAQILYMRARIEMENDHYASAEGLMLQALDIQTGLQPSRDLALMLRYMGRIKDYCGKGEEAIAYCREAIALASSLGSVGEYATALFDLAAVLRDWGSLDEARANAEEGLVQIRVMGDRHTEMNILEQLGIIAYRQERYQDALENGQASLKLALELSNSITSTYLLILLGDVYLKVGRLEFACRMRSEALPLARAMNHPRTSEIQNWLQLHCSPGIS